MKSISMFLGVFLAFVGAIASANGYFGKAQDEFLKLDDAFKPTASRTENGIEVSWQVAPGYYLYEKQFRFQVQDATGTEIPMMGRPSYSPAGIERHDEFMGQVVTFSEVVDITVPVRIPDQAYPIQVRVDFQGCAEKGLCYPPSTRKLQVQ